MTIQQRTRMGTSPHVTTLPSPGGLGVRLGEGPGVRAADHERSAKPPKKGLS
jgi:hypothetical protein